MTCATNVTIPLTTVPLAGTKNVSSRSVANHFLRLISLPPLEARRLEFVVEVVAAGYQRNQCYKNQ
jgi:hypothetical protein